MNESKAKKLLSFFSKSTVRLFLFAFFVTFFLLVLLLSWGEISSTDRFLLNDRLLLKKSFKNITVYHLDISDIDTDQWSSLHFKSYGNVITIDADGKKIYSYGQEYAKKHMDIGRIYVSAHLPENTKIIRITLTLSDADASSVLKKIELCTKEDVGRYYLSNDTLGFPMALIYIVLGVTSILASFAGGRHWHSRRALLYFGLILFCMSIELADTGGHYLTFFRNQHRWNILFYFASYLLPIAAPCYFFTILGEYLRQKQKRIALGGIWICTACAGVEIFLSLITRLRFCDFYMLARFSLITSVCVGIYFTVYMIKKGFFKKIFFPFVLGTLLWGGAAILLSFAFLPTTSSEVVTPMDLESLESILLLVILLISLARTMRREVEKIRSRQLQILRLQTELQDMRFRTFASQMHPHFLYNALSSIRQIIYEDPKYAEKLLFDFTMHLRSTIRAMTNDHPIPFEEEMKNIKAYVSIEKVRLQDKLSIEYDTPAIDFYVIPLSIQPLVENAIRHGVYKRGETGGSVTVISRETPDGWKIQVNDTGVGFDVKSVLKRIDAGEKDSAGLKNLIFRLENLMHANVEINSTVGTGTFVTVTIPKNYEVVK